MSESTPASSLIDSARRLGSGLVAALHDRLELVAVEAHEEALRILQIVIWINAAIFTGMLAVTFISLAVVFLFWESARLTAVLILAGVYTAGFVAVIVVLRRLMSSVAKPFEATRTEIAKDQECIQPEN